MNGNEKQFSLKDMVGQKAYFVYELTEGLDEQDNPETVEHFVAMFHYRNIAENYVRMAETAESDRRYEILKRGGQALDQLEAPKPVYEIRTHKLDKLEIVPEVYMDVTAPIMGQNEPRDMFADDVVYMVKAKLPDKTEKLLAFCDNMIEAANAAELLTNQNGYYCYWQKMDDEDASIFLSDYRAMVGAAYNDTYTPNDLGKVFLAYDKADAETKARVRKILEVQ